MTQREKEEVYTTIEEKLSQIYDNLENIETKRKIADILPLIFSLI